MKAKKFFYSHLAEVDSIFAELGGLRLTKAQKEELFDLAHANLHQIVMDIILSHLNEDDKKKILHLVVLGDDKKIWEHLNQRIEKIEEKITVAAEQTKKELKADIEDVRR